MTALMNCKWQVFKSSFPFLWGISHLSVSILNMCADLSALSMLPKVLICVSQRKTSSYSLQNVDKCFTLSFGRSSVLLNLMLLSLSLPMGLKSTHSSLVERLWLPVFLLRDARQTFFVDLCCSLIMHLLAFTLKWWSEQPVSLSEFVRIPLNAGTAPLHCGEAPWFLSGFPLYLEDFSYSLSREIRVQLKT